MAVPFNWFTNTKTIDSLRKWKYYLFILSALLLVTILIETIVRIYDSYKKFGLVGLASNIDPFSILVGIFGIALSWVIFLYVKQESQEQNEDYIKRVEQLNIGVTGVNKAVYEITRLVKDYSSIQPVHGLTKRLLEIKKVYEHAFKQHNDLYIMTNNVLYGKVLMHELKSLIEDRGRDRTTIETWSDLYFHPFRNAEKLINNFSELLNNKEIKPSDVHVHIITLDEEKHRSMVNRIIDKPDVKVKCISGAMNNKKNEKHKFLWNHDTENYYLYHSNESQSGDNEHLSKQLLKDYLTKDNSNDYDLLFPNDDIEIVRLSNIPFQFIASIPKTDSIDYDASCVLIFSNLYASTSAGDEATACFSSINAQLIKNLKDVFYSIVKKHKEILAEEKNVKEFFGIGPDLKKVCFIRHQSVTKDSPEAEGETSIQFVDDILTTEKLKRKLIDKFQNHKDFLKDDFYTDQQNFSELSKRFHTMITVGLFKNIVTEKFIGKNGRALDHIDLRIENDNGKKIIVFGKPYSSNFFSKKRHEENIDYALFAKINFTEDSISKTLIICGGCEPYGTKQIGTYINKNFEKMLNNQESTDISTNYQSSDFISVYKIPNHYPKDSDPELVFHYFNRTPQLHF